MLAEYDENGTLTTNYTRADELISQERNGAKSGKKYKYAVHAYVGGKWTEIGTTSTATVKVK